MRGTGMMAGFARVTLAADGWVTGGALICGTTGTAAGGGVGADGVAFWEREPLLMTQPVRVEIKSTRPSE